MKVLAVVVCVLVLVGASGAVADEVGVYFDRGAHTSMMQIPAGIPFEVFVAITELTSDAVYGIEFSYDLIVPVGLEGDLVRLSNSLPPLAIDLGNSSDPLSGEYIVGLAEPLPSADAVVFVAWEFLLMQYIPVYFQLGPTRIQSIDDGMPAYEGGGVIIPLHVNAPLGEPSPVIGGSSEGIYSACVNGCAVPASIQSFGTVKSLYR